MKTLLTLLAAAAFLIMPHTADAQIKNKYVSCFGFLGMGNDKDKTDTSLALSSGGWLCEVAEFSPELLSKVVKVCGFEHCRIRGTISGRGAFEWSEIYSIKRLPPLKKNGDE